MKSQIRELLHQVIITVYEINYLAENVQVERTKNLAHGDYTSNIALVLAKPCQQSAAQIAEHLIYALPLHDWLEKVEVAGVGFINFFIRAEAKYQLIADIVLSNRDFSSEHRFAQPTEVDLERVQYAHARTCSVLRQLKECGLDWDRVQGLANLNLLSQAEEKLLIDLIAREAEFVSTHDFKQIICYLNELANELHNYYNVVSLLGEKEQLRGARLCLLDAGRRVINNGLGLLGVSAPESR